MKNDNRCETCGNDYDKSFMVTMGNEKHIFDSFECAIQKMAPRCEHCEIPIIGHGVEEAGHVFCCAHCARHEGHVDVSDRADRRDSSHEEAHLI